jgi:hypothetical protein
MVTSPLAYPLHWPAELPRSKSRGRPPFKVSLSRAVADLQDSLRLFGTDTGLPIRNIVISSNVTLGAARPPDPGVAVYFEWDGAQRCVAVDRFPKPEDNVRAIYYVLEARRQEMRYGGLHIVRAAFRGFSALPPPRDWRTVLGVGPDADLAAAEAAWREKARTAHPDRDGGSTELMAELNMARAAARRELAA